MGLSSDGVTIKYKDATGQQRVCLASVVHVATCVRVCVCVCPQETRVALLSGVEVRSCAPLKHTRISFAEELLNTMSSGWRPS